MTEELSFKNNNNPFIEGIISCSGVVFPFPNSFVM
jgi:hypothetical protein